MLQITLVPGDHAELVYTIGDDETSYIGFICALRQIIVTDPGCSVLLDSHTDPILGSTSIRQYPLLDTIIKSDSWIHIKLQVAGEETSTIVLAIKLQDFNICGFGNQNRGNVHNPTNYYWYNITAWSRLVNSVKEEEPLRWGFTHDEILLQVRTDDWEKVVDKLNSERLGKTSAANAVRVLSRFSNRTGEDDAEARLALVRLMVMISDSAKLNPVLDTIAGGWNNGTEFTKQLADYIRYWDHISTALVDSKKSRKWGRKYDRLKRIGINNQEDALKIVHLCSPRRMNLGFSQQNLPSEGSSSKN